ncbi:MAG TPA: S26 family signal peptidase [Candidatus Saccharimonadales bacterium]|jgi:nickel-type superoxide dismutase maturation protease
MLVRRVVGDSMLPTLRSNQLVMAFSRVKPSLGNLVIVKYDGKEIIKRLTKIEPGKLYITGDNPNSSSDSRHFGWVSQSDLIATVIWPRKK